MYCCFLPKSLFALTVRRGVTRFVEGRVDRVKVLGIEIILCNANGVAEALIVHELALAQEFDRLADVGVITQTQNVVVRRARLLLCYYHVFATKLSLAKVRKILILQGVTALLKLPIFQKFQ